MRNLMRKLVAYPLAVAVVLAVPSAVLAAPAPPVNVDSTDVSTVTLAAPLVTLIVSLLIPLANGIITKVSTSRGVKVVITIVLNTISALVVNGMVSDGSTTFSSATLYTAVLGSVISIATYAGFYNPLGLTSNEGGKLAGVGRSD